MSVRFRGRSERGRLDRHPLERADAFLLTITGDVTETGVDAGWRFPELIVPVEGIESHIITTIFETRLCRAILFLRVDAVETGFVVFSILGRDECLRIEDQISLELFRADPRYLWVGRNYRD